MHAEVHKINWRWTEDLPKSMQRYYGNSAFKGEIIFRNRKTNGLKVQS